MGTKFLWRKYYIGGNRVIASKLVLVRSDIQALAIKDDYSIHRVVYSLFDDTRSDEEKNSSVPSGILYVDKGGSWNSREILILSNRPPKVPSHGKVVSKQIPDTFLQYDHYGFEISINPTKRDSATKKIIPITGKEQLIEWFTDKALKTWGFIVEPKNTQIVNSSVKIFEKKGHRVTQHCVSIIGKLTVKDRGQFIQSFQKGIGRGRAFGCGLLQITPLSN